MDTVQLAIVGCGGMGGRHLLGLEELQNSGANNIDLVALCDLRADNAAHLADEAERLLGRRPLVFQRLEDLTTSLPELRAVSITTDAGSHHRVAVAALDLGLHVLCEKPLALTMRGANQILAAQARSARVLSVAENYRRDPMSRLTRALLDAGAIGRPYLFLDVSASAGNRIVITPWRHLKQMGGMLLDGGVHNADLMLYYLGDVRQVYAQTHLWEKTRVRPTGEHGVSGFYARWAAEMPASIEATAEDTLVSVLSFESGAMGQWTQSYAGHGQGYGHRTVFGASGSLRPGGTRNGASPILETDSEGPVPTEALVSLVPDYCLDPITARLFGGDRLASYRMPFPDADRKLLAIEYHEFADSISRGTRPEVDGAMGRRAMALCYAAFESGVLNRPVTLDEIEREETGAYEAEINRLVGI